MLNLPNSIRLLELADYDTDVQYARLGQHFRRRDNYQILHCPLEYGWYRLPNDLPEYDYLLINGPSADQSNRLQFLQHIRRFPNTPCLISDTHRSKENYLAHEIAHRWNRSLTMHQEEDRGWAILT